MPATPFPGLHVFPDPDACVRAAARVFLQASLEAVEAHRPFRVALSGGSTPKRLYAVLSGEPEFRDAMPWSKIHFFFSDERHVAPESPESNFGAARDGLFDQVDVPAANIHRVRAELPDAAEAAARYQQTISASFANATETPRFDLVFLGMGPDGHTASLFPGSPAVRERTQWVASNPVEKLKTDRITFTFPLINRAARVLLLVTGDDKAERIASVFGGLGTAEEEPVRLVQPTDGLLEWYLDAPAARLLPQAVAQPAAAAV